MRWSELKKLLFNVLDPELDLDVHCTAYRGEGIQIGRYWIVLNGETIWDEPKNISKQLKMGLSNPVATSITGVLREYLDTPKDELLTKEFPADMWGLIDVLRAADRRIGKRRLEELGRKDISPAARVILEERLRK